MTVNRGQLTKKKPERGKGEMEIVPSSNIMVKF